MAFRQYLVTIIFISLLIWGPIDHSWPGWLIVRISYLILIPLLISLVLRWIWNRWKPSAKMENILIRILCASIGSLLFLMAIFSATSDYHWINTKWIQTRDGSEAVGDDVVVSGPDWGNALILSIVSICVFWFGVFDTRQKKDHKHGKK